MIKAAIFYMTRGALEADEGDEDRWFRDRSIEVFKIKSGVDYSSGVPLVNAQPLICTTPEETQNVKLILRTLANYFKRGAAPITPLEVVFISDDSDALRLAGGKEFKLRTIAVATEVKPSENGKKCDLYKFSSVCATINTFLNEDLQKH